MERNQAFDGILQSIRIYRYVHIPEVTRKKIDDKSFRCVFLGVSQESKAFRMYDPVSKKIVVSRDVVFEEEEKWNWNAMFWNGEMKKKKEKKTWRKLKKRIEKIV